MRNDDQPLLVIGFGIGDRREIDVPERGIRLAQLFQPFADGFRVEDVAIFYLEQPAQCLGVGYRLVAAEGDLFEPVALPLFDGNRDVYRLAWATI